MYEFNIYEAGTKLGVTVIMTCVKCVGKNVCYEDDVGFVILFLEIISIYI